MRVVEVARFGGPDVLEMREYPDPVPKPGQVVVEVSAYVGHHAPADPGRIH